MKDITALILTLNEKENIRRTLHALGWVERVVIADSFSTDETVEIAKASNPNVRVEQRSFDTHAAQWNFGLSRVETEWVLSLDADYEISPELANEIRRLNPPSDIVGYQADFEYRIFGRPLRASVYPPRVVLFRRGRCVYYDDGHTQRLKVSGTILPLTGRIYHDDRKPLSRWIYAQDKYAEIEARHLMATPTSQLSFQDRLRKRIFFAPLVMPIFLLFGRGLILDGWPGWFYVAQRTIAELMLSIRLLIERKKLEDMSK